MHISSILYYSHSRASHLQSSRHSPRCHHRSLHLLNSSCVFVFFLPLVLMFVSFLFALRFPHQWFLEPHVAHSGSCYLILPLPFHPSATCPSTPSVFAFCCSISTHFLPLAAAYCTQNKWRIGSTHSCLPSTLTVWNAVKSYACTSWSTNQRFR